MVKNAITSLKETNNQLFYFPKLTRKEKSIKNNYKLITPKTTQNGKKTNKLGRYKKNSMPCLGCNTYSQLGKIRKPHREKNKKALRQKEFKMKSNRTIS